MRKLVLAFLVSGLVLASMTVSVNSQSSGFFEVSKVYWGLDQPMEVSPGDAANLSVVLRYLFQYPSENLKAELSLPNGLRAVGGGQRSSTYKTGTISIGSTVQLQFSIFVTSSVGKGGYIAYLQLQSYVPTLSSWHIETLEIPFEVTGKPAVDIQVLNSTLREGSQNIVLLVSNLGDGVANTIRLTNAYSSQASVDLPAVRLAGNLDPGEKLTTSLFVKIPSASKTDFLPLTVQVSCVGPTGVSYTFSRDLQLPLMPSTLSPFIFDLKSNALVTGNNTKLELQLDNVGSSNL